MEPIVYDVIINSSYVDEGFRTFQVIDDNVTDAKDFAEQCICAGKESIVQVIEHGKQ